MASPEEIRNRTATVETVMKLQRIAHGQILETILREIELADRARQEIEDVRSQRRNVNRCIMIAVAWAASLVVPILALKVLHSTGLAFYASSIGYTGDLVVTTWALIRRY
jgi:hypothetical protein